MTDKTLPVFPARSLPRPPNNQDLRTDELETIYLEHQISNKTSDKIFD